MTPRMDAAGPVDAKNAPTGPWKTAQTAVSHSAHTHSRFHEEDEINGPHTKFLTLPLQKHPIPEQSSFVSVTFVPSL